MSITIQVRPRRPVGKWTRRAASALGLASGGFLSGAVALAYYVARRVTAPTPSTPFDAFTFTPFEFDVPYDAVSFPTSDGSILRGWWLRRPASDRVVIACGGYRRRRADLLGISAALWRDGNNVLVFDYRGHGELVGTPVTLGYQEMQDLLAGVALYQESRS